jgi:hypothetical protein
MIKNGTTYHEDTPKQIVDALEQARRRGDLVRLFYGDTDTGKAWAEEYDVTGTVGRSTGSVKVPLLLARSNSSGGSPLLDHCIVAIKAQDCWLYKHPTFETGFFTMRIAKEEALSYEVLKDQKLHARFKTERGAQRYCHFMAGVRFGK